MLLFYFNEKFMKKDVSVYYPPGNDVLAAKVCSCIALQLFIYPNINNGLLIMKYANNNGKAFTKESPSAAYLLGFL